MVVVYMTTWASGWEGMQARTSIISYDTTRFLFGASQSLILQQLINHIVHLLSIKEADIIKKI
jgi:hypothetical protein